MQPNVLQVDSSDNVAVALCDLSPGRIESVGSAQIEIQEVIPSKHKFALTRLDAGDEVIMYNVLVGRAKTTIPQGGLISTQNITHDSRSFSLRHRQVAWQPPEVKEFQDLTFMGYHRENGGVGTMNYWLVVPLVFCENRNIEVIKNSLLDSLGYNTIKQHAYDINELIGKFQRGASKDEILSSQLNSEISPDHNNRLFRNVDGIKFLTHEGGCGCSRQDGLLLSKLIASYIMHPNVAGATVLSLGCQVSQYDQVVESIKSRNGELDKPVYFLEQQASKSEREFLEDAIKQTFVGLMQANESVRKPAPLSKLTIGLECGGSDGFSGLSANPALGFTSDLLVALGGKTVLAEFPELCGVEQELMDRCISERVAHKFSDLMRSYAKRAEAAGSGFEFNPSPGNIRDGLITDAMKSAGAAKKGGSSPVADVLDYGEIANEKGLSLLCTPGGDVESTTGLAGAGANLIVFTTGLGTPTGNAVTPVVKVSTNDKIAKSMSDIIDFNAGGIISKGESIQKIGRDLLMYLVEVASGNITPAAVRLGQDDFIPWKRDISL